MYSKSSFVCLLVSQQKIASFNCAPNLTNATAETSAFAVSLTTKKKKYSPLSQNMTPYPNLLIFCFGFFLSEENYFVHFICRKRVILLHNLAVKNCMIRVHVFQRRTSLIRSPFFHQIRSNLHTIRLLRSSSSSTTSTPSTSLLAVSINTVGI